MRDKAAISVLYITYLGLLEPIPKSQVLPYLLGLTSNADIHLLSFEKRELIRRESDEFKRVKHMLQKKGIIWHRLVYHKRPLVISSFFDIAIGAIVSLSIVIRHKISLLHVRSNIPIAIGFIVKSLSRVRLLYDRRGIMGEDHTEHSGWKPGGLLYRLAIWFEKIAMRRSDAIVVLSQRMNRELRQDSNLSEKLIETIPCCIDLQKFGCDGKRNNDLPEGLGLNGKFVFVYSGSVGTYNLLGEMFDFFQVAQEIIPNAHLLILTHNKGSVSKFMDIRKDVDKRKVSLLSVSQDEIPLFLSSSDAGLIFRRATNTAIAAFPTKFAEYLTCGLPVIALFGIGDLGEIINSNGIGVVLNSYDRTEYKKAVRRLFSLLEAGDKLREKCIRFAKENFSANRGIAAYLNIYRNLASRNRAAEISAPSLAKTHRVRFNQHLIYLKSPSHRQLKIMQRRVFTRQNYESQMRYFSLIGYNPQSCILDVGANIGYMSLFYSLIFPESKVIALEPSKLNFQYLTYNCKAYPHIICFNLGSHHTSAEAFLSMPSSRQNPRVSGMRHNTGLFSIYGNSGRFSEKVDLVSLDEFLPSRRLNDKIGFIKIDVEGNEFFVLKGASGLIDRQGPVIKLEINPTALEMSSQSFREIREFLADFRYRPFEFNGAELLALKADSFKETSDVTFVKSD